MVEVPGAVSATSKSVTLYPYRTAGRWVFDVVADDVRTQLPVGLDALIDELTASIAGAEGGVALTLALQRGDAPAAELALKSSTDVLGWRLYEARATKTMGFASPALLHYFPETPETLYVSAEAMR